MYLWQNQSLYLKMFIHAHHPFEISGQSDILNLRSKFMNFKKLTIYDFNLGNYYLSKQKITIPNCVLAQPLNDTNRSYIESH